MSKLNVGKIRALNAPGLFGDGGTLYLRVAPTGSKSWIQRLVVHGRRRDLGLGGYPLVSLAEAREAAFENRRLARRGLDPVAARRRARVPSFGEAAQRTFEINAPGWRNAKHRAQWLRALERHALPRLGDMPVDQIAKADVLAVLTPLWNTWPEAARKLRHRIRAVLGWAQAQGYVERNVADDIDGGLPAAPRKPRKHFRALPYEELPAALDTIEHSRACLAARCCLRFVVLTACRSGEARGARWDEIDLDERVWTIPAQRMKNGREWEVPLTAAAVAVLERTRVLRDPSGLVFPSPVRPGRPLSDMALTKVLRDVGLAERATVHGMRTCFRSWAGDRTNARPDLMEKSLAHGVGAMTERGYDRATMLKKRRRLLKRWARFATAE